ncbi:nucleotide pyrophosphohydrolase [Paenacidovorax monticola]|uniref:Nucleotide pyrophosphohydrolase n=1 Tax=Paenacidovorax monticola TaxID=1926868 RepID=A0A7H0HBK6_9BURK|nr:nucleotide pyrophosphohydrolase [Paenacidovorax monticola]
MDISTLQRRLRAFAAARDWEPFHAPKNLAMALMVEAAELLELFQWQTLTESRGFTRNAADKERVADEIADVLLYLLQLADHTGVDVEQAVEHKLRKNAEKHPAKHAEPAVPPALSAVPRAHLLVDWENVQPSGEALKVLVPQGTDVWLFHGPQQKVNAVSHAQVYGKDRVTLVPRSGAGRNALDFQLSYYLGYITARQPGAAFVVVSNDQGYDPMLEHARELEFDARRCVFSKPAPKQEPALPAPVQPVAQPKLPVAAAPAKANAPAKSPDSAKATRQDVQRLAQLLHGMPPAQRPMHKDALLALLQAHMGEIGMLSPRVVHALAQLQAQKHVALKGSNVRYPPEPATPASSTAAAVAKKKAVPAKKAAAAAKQAPAKAAPKPTAPQITQAVLASLKKMPGNKPTRHAGLLKFIETHTAKATDPKAMAQQVCALLEARKEVVVSPDGKGISYPQMSTKKAAGAR